MKRIAKFVAVVALALVALGATGCMPYDVPEFKEITPSQTALLLPLEGKTSDQQQAPSEAFYKEHLVFIKKVAIPHKAQKTGRMYWSVKYVPTVRLIVVERKPVAREWTEDPKTGTKVTNQGISAETKESIGFVARMNCVAQIEETAAVRYLYRYNDRTLDQVMDSEIRADVSALFTEKCGSYTLDDLLVNKGKVMNEIRTAVKAKYADRGVNITVLGLQGEFSYLNPKIQEAIDNKFRAEREYQAQKFTNSKTVEEAAAKAAAARKLASAANSYRILKQFELREKELANEAAWIAAWDKGGAKVPEVVTGGNSSFLYSRPNVK